MQQQPTTKNKEKKERKRRSNKKKIAQKIYSFTWQTRAAPQQTINGLKVERNWVSNRSL